eukprot:6347444-Prymnesium_polylepis.1
MEPVVEPLRIGTSLSLNEPRRAMLAPPPCTEPRRPEVPLCTEPRRPVAHGDVMPAVTEPRRASFAGAGALPRVVTEPRRPPGLGPPSLPTGPSLGPT